MPASSLIGGVLALQGSYEAHARALRRLGLDVREVRMPGELEGIELLCMPGGESTAMSLLLDTTGLREPLRAAIAGGLPVLATCAGAILLAQRLEGNTGSIPALPLGLLDATVDRNAYGRQVDSFEATLELDWAALGLPEESGPFPGVFIRAPRLRQWGDGVVPVATQPAGPHGEAEVVMLRQGSILASAFHPELSGDDRVHAALVKMARNT